MVEETGGFVMGFSLPLETWLVICGVAGAVALLATLLVRVVRR